MSRDKQAKQAYNREWYQRNKERQRLKNLEWRKQNPERSRELHRKTRERIRLAVLNALGGKCVRCGITDPRVLQINHLNGDGRKDKHNGFLNTNRIYKGITTGERKDLNVLCANCNILYEYDLGRRTLFNDFGKESYKS